MLCECCLQSVQCWQGHAKLLLCFKVMVLIVGTCLVENQVECPDIKSLQKHPGKTKSTAHSSVV